MRRIFADNRTMPHLKILRHSYLIAVFMLCIVVLSAYKPGTPPDPVEGIDAGMAGGETSVKRTPKVVRSLEAQMPFGTTLDDLLTESGFTEGEAFDVIESLAGVMDMRRIPKGQVVDVDFTEGDIPLEVRLPIRFDRTVRTRRTELGWQAEEILIDVVTNPVVMHTTVKSSLYRAAKDSGIPLSVMMQAIDLFSYNVDFQREIHPGDTVELVYEMFEDTEGRILAAGDLLFGSLTTGRKRMEAWRYQRLDGTAEYYEEGGDSVRRSIIKTPVNGARISSGFGYRKHPIWGYTAMHRGVDFAVPTGTPVKAAGDGRVLVAGWHNLYGNWVKMRHANNYDTVYAHFSRIAPGIRPGRRIKQGTVVGYVGSTGNSTGPHLHYELHYFGKPVNPAKLQFPPGHRLSEQDKRLFDLNRRALKAGFEIVTAD